MDVLKFGFQYWKRRLLSAIFVQFLSFTAILCDLMLPLLSAILVDYVLMKSEIAPQGIFRFLLNGTFGEVHTIQLFFAVGAFYLGLVLLRILLIYIKSIWFQHLGLQFETELRSDTFHKLMELDSQSVSRYHTGELLQTIHSDTIMFKEMFCRMIPGVIDSFFLLVMSISLLAFINVHFLWIPVFLAPLLVFTFYRFRRRAKENFARIRESNADLNLKVRENIEAVRLVRSFTNEEMEKQQFDGKNNTLRDAHLRQINLHSQFEAIIGGYKQFAFITTIVISSLLIMKGFMSVGYLVTCSAYMMRIMDHITHINGTMVQMQQQIVSGEKMLSFLQAQSKIPDGKSHKETAKNPHIRLEKVGLTLDGQRILEDISIDLPYGKKLGIVGETGSGKSVLLKLLVRIYDVTEGRIEVNGKKISHYSLKALRNMCSYVFQDVFLFSNTIDSNIAYGVPNIEKELVEQAAKDAQAHDFISQLPQGYDTIVGERGYGISGGQKQRVSIARALVKKAPILIFDDSTSALDVQTERKLLEGIWTNYQQRTVIITAHRLSSVLRCDEILYMQDGKIVERGSFDELMAKDGLFASVYKTQQAQYKENIQWQ